MFERQRKTKIPCDVCKMRLDICICDAIPKLDLKTRVCLVIHHRELKRTTNTGRLAMRALTNSQMLVRGEIGQSLDLTSLLSDNYRTLLFYPSDKAIALTSDFVAADPRPIQLIVPDGNWRQASKVHYRHDEIRDIPRVMIRPTQNFGKVLRTETKEDGMATLQAIAEALGVIEGSEVREKLMGLYQMKLERTLAARGQPAISQAHPH